jgi:hypothetical protein
MAESRKKTMTSYSRGNEKHFSRYYTILILKKKKGKRGVRGGVGKGARENELF